MSPRKGKKFYRKKAGMKHRSLLEDRVIKNLETREIKYEYEKETLKYEKRVRNARCIDCGSKHVVVSSRYTPDLLLGTPSFFVEVKGKFTAANRSRMEAVLKSYPGIDLRFLFQADNWITKAHKSRYSDWCKKLGVKYHVGEEVPQGWVST